jgi:hypothetical protein
MTSSNLRGVIEVIGVFAVVASLLFVGLQLMQEQEIALSNQYH